MTAIQDVALVMLPGFIGSIASIAVLSASTISRTDAGELASQLTDIVGRLKSSTA